MWEIFDENEHLFYLMLQNEKNFNCIINNTELFECFRDYPDETQEFLKKKSFRNHLVLRPKNMLNIMKKGIKRREENKKTNSENN